jgi:hypothetical protein
MKSVVVGVAVVLVLIQATDQQGLEVALVI